MAAGTLAACRRGPHRLPSAQMRRYSAVRATHAQIGLDIPPCEHRTAKHDHRIPLPEAPAPDPPRLKVSPSPSLQIPRSPIRLVWPKPRPRGGDRAASCSMHKKERERLHGESAAGGGPPQEQGEALAKCLRRDLASPAPCTTRHPVAS